MMTTRADPSTTVATNRAKLKMKKTKSTQKDRRALLSVLSARAVSEPMSTARIVTTKFAPFADLRHTPGASGCLLDSDQSSAARLSGGAPRPGIEPDALPQSVRGTSRPRALVEDGRCGPDGDCYS